MPPRPGGPRAGSSDDALDETLGLEMHMAAALIVVHDLNLAAQFADSLVLSSAFS